jgi:hypothetical protein
MSAKAGLVGIYQPPTLVSNANAVYLITDDDNDSLYVFILFPGAYNTAYEYASRPMYRNVFIVPVSLDALYVSDVTRLVNDLYTKKNIVKVLYPGKFSAYTPVAVQKALISSGRKTFYQYKNGIISFNFKMTDSDYQPNFYDIYATFRTRRCLFCPFEVKKERLLALLRNNDVDWIYVPYSDPLFGTDSYASLVIDEDFEPYMDKIIAFGFLNETQENYCKGRYPKSFPRTIRALLAGAGSSFDTGFPPVEGVKSNSTSTTTPVVIDTPDTPSPQSIEHTPGGHFPAPFPKPLPDRPKPIDTSYVEENTRIDIPEEASEDE